MADRRVKRHPTTLSIIPRSSYVSYAFVEDDKILDSSVKTLKLTTKSQRTQRAVQKCVELLDYFSPELLLLPKLQVPAARREHGRTIITAVAKEAFRRGINVVTVSVHQVRTWLNVSRPNKHSVHKVLTELYPELRGLMRPRPVWKSEPYSSIWFDAVALYAAWRRMPIAEESH